MQLGRQMFIQRSLATRHPQRPAGNPEPVLNQARHGRNRRQPSHAYPTTSGTQPLPVASGCMAPTCSGTP